MKRQKRIRKGRQIFAAGYRKQDFAAKCGKLDKMHDYKYDAM